MTDERWPISRRGFMRGVGAGTAISLMSAQAAANSPVFENTPVDDVHVLDNLMVPMRDDVKLSTDVYLPDLSGESEKVEEEFPTLVARTPYNKEGYEEQAKGFAQHKYAVVIQDVRGKFGSEGSFYPYRSMGNAEDKDGYDTVEWAADQTWSNGKVGTFGISYLAGTQWAITHNEELPPHLETMAPGYSVASYYGQGAYSGGAALLSHNLDYMTGFAVEKYNRQNPEKEDEFTFLDAAWEAMPQLHWDLPVVPFKPLQRVGDDSGPASDQSEDIVGTQQAGYPWFDDWLTHQTYGDYWKVQDHTRHYDKVDIPVLNYGGWYDIFDQGTIWNFEGLRENAGQSAQDAATLVVGPYTHGANTLRAQGAVMGAAYYFPQNATFDSMPLLLSWFDRVLKDDSASSTESAPPVRLYVPGLDEWVGVSHTASSGIGTALVPETEFTKYYLHSDGNANVGDITDEHYRYEGVLSTEKPNDEKPDEYTYDPSDPVVTNGGYNTHWHGGVNDRSTTYHRRDDILVYETDILEKDVAVVGPITATLYASTSAEDTDFVVTLSDVEPIARPGGIRIAEGARRGRIGDVSANPREQETYTEVNLLEPEKVYEWKIAVWPTARVFEAGRRIRIDITSSDFPRYSRNLNTGEGPTGTEMAKAHQTIYHDADRPSHVEMPIIPMEELEGMIIDGPIPGKAGEENESSPN
jgi:putative CocE/NonD family hydrolase